MPEKGLRKRVDERVPEARDHARYPDISATVQVTNGYLGQPTGLPSEG
jgi:hypothetical protein